MRASVSALALMVGVGAPLACGEVDVNPVVAPARTTTTCPPEGCAPVCEGGVCVCPSDFLTCDGLCVNVQTDVRHCGECGVECLGGARCAGGVCLCTPSGTYCAGECVNTLTDARHCGGCDQACLDPTVCAAGECR